MESNTLDDPKIESKMDLDPSPFHLAALKTLIHLQNANLPNFEDEETVLSLPRRRCAREYREEAATLAQLLYPDYTPTKAVIHYDALLAAAKRSIRKLRLQRQVDATKNNKAEKDKQLVIQGPWAGQDVDPLDLEGPKGIPMPVQIGSEDDFKDVFNFLKQGENAVEFLSMNNDDEEKKFEELKMKKTKELLWGTPCLEFHRGIIYSDGRLDLCKMVVGPTHIEQLMTSLTHNPHITQFLLGNNIISTTGAKAVAKFIETYPERIETWYLAGCHLTAPAFKLLVDAMVKSSKITNFWVKRNPLTPAAVGDLGRLIAEAVKLRTLDLENTELGDAGIAKLFSGLEGKEVALRTIYLNANGMGASACKSFPRFLGHPSCKLENVFMASNPIGDAGMEYLAPAIAKSRTLKRLGLQSVGLTSHGVCMLADAVREGGTVFSLDIGASQTTKVHNQRFSHISERAIPALIKLIEAPHMRGLVLGRTSLSQHGIDSLRQSVSNSSLVYFDIHRIRAPDEEFAPYCPLALHRTLMENVKKFYTGYEKYAEFEYGEDCRFLWNTPDVRLIDSMYRTRDKRMNIPIDSVWPENDETWKLVLEDAEQEL